MFRTSTDPDPCMNTNPMLLGASVISVIEKVIFDVGAGAAQSSSESTNQQLRPWLVTFVTINLQRTNKTALVHVVIRVRLPHQGDDAVMGRTATRWPGSLTSMAK
jgi:hypothetical protein